jgi:hypothetical protein
VYTTFIARAINSLFNGFVNCLHPAAATREALPKAPVPTDAPAETTQKTLPSLLFPEAMGA